MIGRRDTILAAMCMSVAILLMATNADALVLHDSQRTVKGVLVLQDATDSTAFYYVPQYPRLATRPDGTFELLCLKYVDKDAASSGGLFHALVEFTLPPELADEVAKELEKQVPGAKLMGPVPLQPAVDEGENGMGSFRVISAVLADKEKGTFTRSLITSGRAPVTPGSRAVVAALLNQQGATLLWNSMTGPTSDVSVEIRAFYEAQVRAFNAKITADVDIAYTHFSRVSNVQEGFTKRQLRKIVDDLQRNGTLKVEVMDRSKGLGVESKDMQAILNICTDKLTELMFDQENGLTKEPEREVAVEAGQIQGRQERGWFSRTFGGAQNTPYFSDDQYVLKRRTDIRKAKFNVILDQQTTIRVPVDTAGNLGGLHAKLGADPRYFRIVNMDDPAFEKHTVHFQIDGGYVDAFQDSINAVSVNVRKTYSDGRKAFTKSVHFTHADVKAGKTIQPIDIFRLDETGASWKEFEYQVRWNVRDRPTMSVPAREDDWIKTSDAAVALVPPFQKTSIEVDTDLAALKTNGYAAAGIEFACRLGGAPKIAQRTTVRASAADPTIRLTVYHDRDTPIAYRVTWHSSRGKTPEKMQLLDGGYVLLNPPPVPGNGAAKPPEGGGAAKPPEPGGPVKPPDPGGGAARPPEPGAP